MTPTLQTRQHPNGDCMRACIAGLLDMPIQAVPDFTAPPGAMEPHAENGYPVFYLEMQTFLARMGYALIEIQLDRRTWAPLPFEVAAIFIGPHAESDCRHAIVGRCEGDSFFPIFDPLGTSPITSFKDMHISAVCFLVALDPVLQRRLGTGVDQTHRLAAGLPPSPIKEAIMSKCRKALGQPEEIIRMPELDRPPRGISKSLNGSTPEPPEEQWDDEDDGKS